MKKLLKTILATMLIISTFSGIPSVYANDDTQGENTATIEEVQQVETALEDEPETKEVVEQPVEEPVEEPVVTTEPQPIENVDNTVTNENEEKSEPVVTFKVTFIGYDEAVLGEQDVNAGETAIAPETPSIEGLEFIGWDKDFANIQEALTIKALYEAPTTDNNALEESNSKTRQSNVNCWGHCDDDEVYKVHYLSGNGGMGQHEQFTDDGEFTALSYEETGIQLKEGFKFLYWENVNNKSDKYHAGQEYEIEEDLNLRAIYEEEDVPEKYSLTYYGNGAYNPSNVKDLKEYSNDEVATLIGNPFKKYKKVFIGWSMTKNSTVESEEDVPSDLLQPDGTVVIKGNTKIFAVWAEDSNNNNNPDYLDYHITYDLNGGYGIAPWDDKTYTPSDNKATIKNTNAYKHDHKFLGWNTNKDTVEASVQPGATVIVTDNIKYYAIWGAKTPEPETYGVIYDGNGETSGEVFDNGKYEFDATVTLLGNDFTKNQAVFIGWSMTQYSTVESEEDVPSDLLQPGGKVVIKDNTKIYAVWAKDSNNNKNPDYLDYHITYDLNGEEGIAPTDENIYTLTNKKATILNINEDVKHDGYEFLGWNTDRYAKEASVQPGADVEITEDTTYYAIWQEIVPETFEVIYDGNEKTSGEVIDSEEYEAEALVTLKENDFEKDQAVFIGWSTDAYDIVKSEEDLEAKTIYFAGNKLQMPVGGLTIYAVWAEDLNGNGKEDYKESFTITTSIDEYGTIDSGAEDLALYSDFVVKFNANLGYKIKTVTVDDKTLDEKDYSDDLEVGIYVYEFEKIDADHNIDVITVIDDAQTKAVNVKYIKEDRQSVQMDPTDIKTLNVQVLDEFIAKGTVDDAIAEYEAENAGIFDGYILESVTPKANEYGFGLHETETTDITYKYVADGNGDEIPDKYQVIFNYQIADADAATLSGPAKEYVTRLVDDKYSTEAFVSPEANIEYTTNLNYRFVNITDNNSVEYGSIDAIKEATFDEDTTFTLNFEYVAPVAPTPVPTPGPTTPPNEGCPAGTVWNDANQSCEVIQQPVIVEPIIVPIPAPEPEEEVVIDDLTPEVAPAPTVTPETIEDDLTPEVGRGSWALINLLSALGTMVLAIILLFVKNKKDEENDEENMNEEDTKAAKRNKMYKALSIAVAVLSVIVFVLTENITLKMVYVDKYTVVMIALLVVNAICFFVGRKGEEQVEDSDQVNS